jgi:hypothetical protein
MYLVKSCALKLLMVLTRKLNKKLATLNQLFSEFLMVFVVLQWIAWQTGDRSMPMKFEDLDGRLGHPEYFPIVI